MSIFEIIRNEIVDFFRNLKEDFLCPELILQLPYDDIGDVNLFTKIMEYYGIEASHKDFIKFIQLRSVISLNYKPIEYMILYASKQKHNDISNKRILFLRFCVTNNIAFTEDLFIYYLEWSEENCIDETLNRWQKMEKWLIEGVEEVM